MKVLLFLAAIAVCAYAACHHDRDCGNIMECPPGDPHPVCDLHSGLCRCGAHHGPGMRAPGTCTDDDFRSCTCEHGGTPACQHGHCHCNHH